MLQLGLAGFGRLSQKYYAPALRALSGVRLSAVADPLPASRAAAAAVFPGVAALSDPGDLLVQPLDGIIVASPPSTHLGLWNSAARAGLPVLLEKPFLLRRQLSLAMSDARERRLLMIDLNRRFWPPYRRIREWVGAGVLGDLEFLEIKLHVDIRPWCSVTSHRLQPDEGGVLYDLGSQAVDLASWLTHREPRAVSVRSESRRWQNDHVLLELTLNGGLRARCDLAYGERGCEQIAVHGRRGRSRLFDPNMTAHWIPGAKSKVGLLGRAQDMAVLCYRGLRRSQSMLRYSVAAALTAFTDSIKQDLPFSPGFEDAAINAQWLDAAARAMEVGRSVGSGEISRPGRNHA